MGAYAAMIADPCNSVLAPGIFGDQEGLLARVKSTYTNPGTNGQTCGYILWSPDYHSGPINAGSYNVGPANLFCFSNADPSYNPLNEPSAPFGSDQINTVWNGAATAASLQEPATDLLDAELVADARTISSCMKMTYTGPMFTAAGQYCVVEGLPLNSLLANKEVGDPTYSPSVNDLFRLATRSGRFGTDTREAVSRPHDNAHIFRDKTIAPIQVGDSGNSASTQTTIGETQQPVFYGFAWRGIPGDTAHPIVFDLIKALEWRPRPVSGLTHAPPRAINKTSMVQPAVAHLDKTYGPSWTDRLASSATGLASQLAKTAFTGIATTAARQMIGMAQAAPLAALTLL